MKSLLRNLVVLLALLFPPSSIARQYPVPTVERGRLEIHGRVTDSTGVAVIPGVVVLATNPEISLARLTVTDESGKYVLHFLTAGRYNVSTDLPGFATSRQDIDLQVAAPNGIDFVLEVASSGPGEGVISQTPMVEGARVTEDAKGRLDKGVRLIEQTWEFSMQISGIFPSSGIQQSADLRKRAIIKEFESFGPDGLPALILALKDPDVQMRRNADIILMYLAMGLSNAGQHKLDIRGALPTLTGTLEDKDGYVRAWSAQSIGAIGPEAKSAVPALIQLLKLDEAERNSSCIALGQIGPAAKDALSALREAALDDASADVRRFAQQAIEKIQ